MKVKGTRAVVTGAGSGIGKATALRLARTGATEVGCVDIDGESAEETASACEALGGAASAWTCDVADAGAVAQTSERDHDPASMRLLTSGHLPQTRQGSAAPK